MMQSRKVIMEDTDEYLHTDINGNEYKLSELGDSHLDNIIRQIDRIVETGYVDLAKDKPEEYESIGFIDKEHVLEYFNYQLYVDERNRRDRKKNVKI